MPCGFVEVHHTTTDGFWNLVRCSHFRSQFPVASVNLLFARHGCVHGPFQFSPRIFESDFVILAIRINKVNSSQSSCIVEFWHLVFPCLFSSILSGFTNFCPYFWSYMSWSGSRLNFCRSPRAPQISLGRFFIQQE